MNNQDKGYHTLEKVETIITKTIGPNGIYIIQRITQKFLNLINKLFSYCSHSPMQTECIASKTKNKLLLSDTTKTVNKRGLEANLKPQFYRTKKMKNKIHKIKIIKSNTRRTGFQKQQRILSTNYNFPELLVLNRYSLLLRIPHVNHMIVSSQLVASLTHLNYRILFVHLECQTSKNHICNTVMSQLQDLTKGRMPIFQKTKDLPA